MLWSAAFARVHALLEGSPLHGVARQRERCSEVLARGLAPSAAKLKLTERRVVERIGGDAIAVGDRMDLFEPALGTSCCATAMARLSATTGEGRMVISVS